MHALGFRDQLGPLPGANGDASAPHFAMEQQAAIESRLRRCECSLSSALARATAEVAAALRARSAPAVAGSTASAPPPVGAAPPASLGGGFGPLAAALGGAGAGLPNIQEMMQNPGMQQMCDASCPRWLLCHRTCLRILLLLRSMQRMMQSPDLMARLMSSSGSLSDLQSLCVVARIARLSLNAHRLPSRPCLLQLTGSYARP